MDRRQFLAPGLEVRYVRDSGHACPEAKDGRAVKWTAYAQGAYLEVIADSTCYEQVIEPVACPKVRKGVETRYHFGRWEKFLKADGWIAA